MKIKQLYPSIRFIIFLLILSCSSENNNRSDIIPDSPNTIKYVSRITSVGFHQKYGYDSDTLIYNNKRLTKALFYGCSGMIHQFEYGTNGKIVTHFIVNGSSISYDLETDISILKNTSIKKITHTYNSQNKLIKTEEFSKSQFTNDTYESQNSYQFEYDSQGRIYRVLYLGNKGYSFTVGVDKFDNKGNVILDFEGNSYEYDSNPNPMYILFEKFGLYYIQSCSSLESNNLFLTPNNLIKFYDDKNKLGCFTAMYTYDNEGYPKSSYHRNCGNGEYDTEFYEY